MLCSYVHSIKRTAEKQECLPIGSNWCQHYSTELRDSASQSYFPVIDCQPIIFACHRLPTNHICLSLTANQSSLLVTVNQPIICACQCLPTNHLCLPATTNHLSLLARVRRSVLRQQNHRRRGTVRLRLRHVRLEHLLCGP